MIGPMKPTDSASSSPKTLVCRGCSLLCDEILVSFDKNHQPQLSHACPKGKNWLDRSLLPPPSPESQQASRQQIHRLLNSANAPLILGLSGLTLEAEAASVNLAETRHGWLCLGENREKILSEQRHGGSVCSWGEVRQRADLILSGNADLFRHWPRLQEKFLPPSGRFLKNLVLENLENKPGHHLPRKLVFLGTEDECSTSSQYDKTIFVTPEQITPAISTLRTLLRSTPDSPAKSEKQRQHTTLPDRVFNQLENLSEDLKQARYPVLISKRDDEQAAYWRELVIEANSQHKMHQICLNSEAACGSPQETVLAMTGFPDAIRFTRSGIEHDLARFQPEHLLKNGQTDLILFVGGTLTSRWRSFLNQIPPTLPLIVIVERGEQVSDLPDHAIVLTAGIAGLEQAGVVLRDDGIPLPARPVFEPKQAGIVELLQELC